MSLQVLISDVMYWWSQLDDRRPDLQNAPLPRKRSSKEIFFFFLTNLLAKESKHFQKEFCKI